MPQGPRNTKCWPWETPILGRRKPPKDYKAYIRLIPLHLACKYVKEMLPHFTTCISGALAILVRGTGLWQGHLLLLWTHSFEAAVPIYHLHIASLKTKPHISFKKVIRWIRKGHRGIILNLLPLGKYNRVANPTFSVICLENIAVQVSYTPRKAHKKNLISKRPWELQSSAGVPEQDSFSHTCQSM